MSQGIHIPPYMKNTATAELAYKETYTVGFCLNSLVQDSMENLTGRMSMSCHLTNSIRAMKE